MVRKINTIDTNYHGNRNPLLEKAKLINDPKNLTEGEKIFIQDLWDTFNSLEDPLGLAANQIWNMEIDWKNNVTNVPSVFIAVINEIPTLFINPEIRGSGGTAHNIEACFSVPNFINYKVHRKRNITIKYYSDIGEYKEEKYFFKDNQTDPMVLQHEHDHLMGKLINVK